MQTGQFLLKKDVEEPDAKKTAETTPPTIEPPSENPKQIENLSQFDTFGGDSEFHRYLDSPERLYVPSDEKEARQSF